MLAFYLFQQKACEWTTIAAILPRFFVSFGGGSMKHHWIAISLASVLLTGAAVSPALGQESATNRVNASSEIRDAHAATLNGGMSLVAELTKGVNSKRAKPGDEVKARVTQDVMAKGLIVLPRESQLVGHVTEAKARSKEDPESRLSIIFDKALLKNGKQIGMSALVQALAPPFGRTAFIDNSDPMIVMANERSTKMLPHLDSDTNRNNPTDSSARSTTPKARLSSDNNIAQTDSSTPWTPGSVLGSGYHGVFGLPGLSLTSGTANQRPVITSIKNDVKLESGTQVVLKVINIDQ
jgi:hypothetical protein